MGGLYVERVWVEASVCRQPPEANPEPAPQPRGFHVCYIREELPVPSNVNVATGAVACVREPVHRFRISFETKGVRDDVAVGWRWVFGVGVGVGVAGREADSMPGVWHRVQQRICPPGRVKPQNRNQPTATNRDQLLRTRRWRRQWSWRPA